MFPIHDTRGRVIGFGGRVLGCRRAQVPQLAGNRRLLEGTRALRPLSCAKRDPRRRPGAWWSRATWTSWRWRSTASSTRWRRSARRPRPSTRRSCSGWPTSSCSASTATPPGARPRGARSRTRCRCWPTARRRASCSCPTARIRTISCAGTARRRSSAAIDGATPLSEYLLSRARRAASARTRPKAAPRCVAAARPLRRARSTAPVLRALRARGRWLNSPDCPTDQLRDAAGTPARRARPVRRRARPRPQPSRARARRGGRRRCCARAAAGRCCSSRRSRARHELPRVRRAAARSAAAWAALLELLRDAAGRTDDGRASSSTSPARDACGRAGRHPGVGRGPGAAARAGRRRRCSPRPPRWRHAGRPARAAGRCCASRSSALTADERDALTRGLDRNRARRAPRRRRAVVTRPPLDRAMDEWRGRSAVVTL